MPYITFLDALSSVFYPGPCLKKTLPARFSGVLVSFPSATMDALSWMYPTCDVWNSSSASSCIVLMFCWAAVVRSTITPISALPYPLPPGHRQWKIVMNTRITTSQKKCRLLTFTLVEGDVMLLRLAACHPARNQAFISPKQVTLLGDGWIDFSKMKNNLEEAISPAHITIPLGGRAWKPPMESPSTDWTATGKKRRTSRWK